MKTRMGEVGAVAPGAVSVVLMLGLFVAYAIAQQAPPPPPPAAPPAVSTEQPPAPVISDTDQLQIQLIESRLQTAQTTIRAAQAEIAVAQQNAATLQEQAKTLLGRLQRPGYEIQRGQDGAYIYAKKTVEKPPAKEPER